MCKLRNIFFPLTYVRVIPPYSNDQDCSFDSTALANLRAIYIDPILETPAMLNMLCRA